MLLLVPRFIENATIRHRCTHCSPRHCRPARLGGRPRQSLSGYVWPSAILTIVSEASKSLCSDEARTAQFCGTTVERGREPIPRLPAVMTTVLPSSLPMAGRSLDLTQTAV